MLIMIALMREPFLSTSAIARSAWWSWSGGLFGAIYIAILIMLLPRIGTFAIVVLIVIGQVIQVAPIGTSRFLSPRGVSVLISEILRVWIPCKIIGIGLYATKGAIAVSFGWLSHGNRYNG